jgi:hypothetical protein
VSICEDDPAPARDPGPTELVHVLGRILLGAERLRVTRGADPHKVIAVALRVGAPSPGLESVVRAAWAAAVGSDDSGPGLGVAAVIDHLVAIFEILEKVRATGTDPREVSGVLPWITAPAPLMPIARAAWLVAIGNSR